MLQIIQSCLLTLHLTLKALFAGIILVISDFITLLKSIIIYLSNNLAGVKRTPQVIQWQGIPSVLTIPAKENLDFNFWRKPTYIIPTLSGMVKHKLAWLLEEKRVEVLPDETLIRWITHGPMSRLANVKDGLVTVDLGVVNTLEFDQDAFLTGPKLQWEIDKPESLIITFADGAQYTPNDGGLWALSKLHMQAAVSLLIPGRFHGNIHFGLPCTAAASLSRLNKNGVLYQLLSPHLRFTLRINNEALRVRRAQDRAKPYAPFAIDGDEFVKSIAGDVQEQLLEPGLRIPPWSLETNNFAFNQFGRSYFEVIKKFVAEVFPFIEESELNIWQSFMGVYIPNIDQQDVVSVLATIIWQVSVLHSADHFTLEQEMKGERYSFNKIRLKSPSQSGVRVDTPIQQVVEMACDTEDRFRSNVFINTFVRGHKHPFWSNTMDNIAYGFKGPELKICVKKFKSNLVATEKQLESEGLNLCPLKNTFQSICW